MRILAFAIATLMILLTAEFITGPGSEVLPAAFRIETVVGAILAREDANRSAPNPDYRA